MKIRSRLFTAVGALLLVACAKEPESAAAAVYDYDVIIRDGTVYDGSGGEPYIADVGIEGDRVAAIGNLDNGHAERVVDAKGLAVSPGFINMLSWATVSLIEDGRAMSDIKQGVTLEVFGEGGSMGPLNAAMKREMQEDQGDISFPVTWTTLFGYLDFLVERGISPNVASFIGATTVRIHKLGYSDRPPTAEELDAMRALVRRAMENGALGVGSSLIYAPAFYADTAELIALAEVAGNYGGLYISHMRSEGDRLLQALDELIAIARAANVAAEIYHLKASGRRNWDKLDELVRRVEAAQAQGIDITADMYTYPASSTGLDATMPPWAQEGGEEVWIARLKDPESRARVIDAMQQPAEGWVNMLQVVGSADNVLLIGFENPELKPLTGKTLAEVAEMRGQSPELTAIELVIEDQSRVEAVYFGMSEENVRRKVQLPWVSFASDSAATAPEGAFLKSSIHPRAYGTFARLLGRYVREEGLISLPEAIRRLTGLPADNLGLRCRGLLKVGYFADLVVFDADSIIDHATYEEPMQYATGVSHVFVNGTQVLRGGKHTGQFPGRVVHGPGWTGWNGNKSECH